MAGHERSSKSPSNVSEFAFLLTSNNSIGTPTMIATPRIQMHAR